MRYRLWIVLSLVTLAAMHARTAAAQFYPVQPTWRQQAALLQFVAAQATRLNQPREAGGACHPTRRGSYGGHRQNERPLGYSDPYVDRRVQDELAHTRAFYEKRRLRQQYFDEQRQRRRLTMQDVQTRRAQHEANLAMMKFNRNVADERAQRQSPGRPDFHQVNPLDGTVHWPATFDEASFAAARSRLDAIFAQRTDGADTYGDRSSEIPRLTRSMRDRLKSMVRDMPPSEYVAAKTFLNKLEYEARFDPPSAGLAAR